MNTYTTSKSLDSSPVRCVALVVLALAASLHSSSAQTWDGGDGSSVNWSTGANWVGDTAPVSATTTVLNFSGTVNRGTTNAPLLQDIASVMDVSRININTNGFFLGGDTLRLNGNTATNGFFVTAAGGGARIFNNIQLAGLTTFASLGTDSEVFYNGNIDTVSHTMRVTPGSGSDRRQTFLGNISGTGSLQLAGGNFTANWVTLSGSNTFSGGVNLDGSGTRVGLRLGSDRALGTGTVSLTNQLVTLIETLGGARTLQNNFTVGNPEIVNQTAANAFTVQSNSDLTINGTFTLNSRTNAPGAGTNFNKAINVETGSTLRLGNVTSAGGTARELRLLGGGGTLEINGDATSLGPITIGDTNSATTLRLGTSGRLSSGNHAGNITNNASFVYAGTNTQTLSGTISGTGSLTQSNSGTLILSGTNTYSGATTVSQGMLVVNGSVAGAMNVASGSVLGGSGTIAGATAISGSLRPGNSIGTLTVANDVTWNSVDAWVFELGGAGPSLAVPGTSDFLSITGTGSDFRKGSGSSWTFDFAGSATTNGWYKLVEWAGTSDFVATDFTGTNLGSGFSSEFTIQNNALYLNVVPEPSTYAMLVLAAVGLAAHQIHRRRRGH